MTRGSAQAGNRAGKTGRYLQWWDTGPECNAVTSAECKVHNSTFLSLLSSSLSVCLSVSVSVSVSGAWCVACVLLSGLHKRVRLESNQGSPACDAGVLPLHHALRCFVAIFQDKKTTQPLHAKADSTLRSSQAVPHPSSNRALRRLTSEVERDPVHSTRYGRQQR